jgi:hypothetical protein
VQFIVGVAGEIDVFAWEYLTAGADGKLLLTGDAKAEGERFKVTIPAAGAASS